MTIDAKQQSRVLYVKEGATVAIDGFSITGDGAGRQRWWNFESWHADPYEFDDCGHSAVTQFLATAADFQLRHTYGR